LIVPLVVLTRIWMVVSPSYTASNEIGTPLVSVIDGPATKLLVSSGRPAAVV
jgi:hypothetical protein